MSEVGIIELELNVSIFNNNPHKYCVFTPKFHSEFVFDDETVRAVELHTLWHAIQCRLSLVGYNNDRICPFEGKTTIYKVKDEFFNLLRSEYNE